MNSYQYLTFLGIVLMLQHAAGRASIPREFMNFGTPFENPPDITRTATQLEANLLKESTQTTPLDPSILAELEQSNEPVIRTFLDENGNNHTATYTKNVNGTISKSQTGSISLKDLTRNSNQIQGVGLVPVNELLQGSGVVKTKYMDENVERHGVYRLNVKTRETMAGNTPISASESRTATTPQATTTATPSTNTARQPNIADSIFTDLNKIFDSYWVQSNNKNNHEIFRPTLLSPQEFFNRPPYVLNPSKFNFFDLNKELQLQPQEPNQPIKETRIASDGKTIVSVIFWPISNNSILTRTPPSKTIIKTKAEPQIVTRAAQLLKANETNIYGLGGLTVGEFVRGL